MTLAARHGPIFPHRKSALPGGYMSFLAMSYGRRVEQRQGFMDVARKARNASDRAFNVKMAREWHRLCMESLALMRQEERATA